MLTIGKHRRFASYERRALQWIYGFAVLGALASGACGGHGSSPRPIVPTSTIVQDVAGVADEPTIDQGLTSAYQSAGFGNGRSSDYNGLEVDAEGIEAQAQGQVQSINDGLSITLSDAYAEMVADAPGILPPLDVFIQKLNADIADSFAHPNDANSVVPILIGVARAPIPSSPPVLAASTPLTTVQAMMLTAWSTARIDHVAAAATTRQTSLSCDLALRRLRFVRWAARLGARLHIYSRRYANQLIANAQANVTTACHDQGDD